MQIKHGTARALGYSGPASGLLDAKVNLTYGVAYLAGAYKTAHGNEAQAYSYYARGYYYAANRFVSAEHGGTPMAMTFDPHPPRVVRPDKAPPLLMTAAQRSEAMAKAGWLS